MLDDTDAHPHHGIVTQDGGFAIIGETSIELRFTMFFVVTDANGNERFKVDLGRRYQQRQPRASIARWPFLRLIP